MITLQTLTHMGTIYKVAVYISAISGGSRAGIWGNVLARQPAASGKERRTRQPPHQSNTGTQAWIDLHKKQKEKERESDRKRLQARPLNPISSFGPPQRDRAWKSGKRDFGWPKGLQQYQEIHFTDGKRKITVAHSLSYMSIDRILDFTDWTCRRVEDDAWHDGWSDERNESRDGTIR